MEVKHWDGTTEEEKYFDDYNDAKEALEEALMRPEVESAKIRKLEPPTKGQKLKRKNKRKSQKKARKRNRK